MGAFRDYAMKYFEQGWSVVPLLSGKNPNFKDWQNFCYERASLEQIQEWIKKDKNWGIGLPMGPANGLVCVDIDIYDEEIVNEIINSLPLSPVIKKGQKGASLFYLFDNHKNESITFDFNKKNTKIYDDKLKFNIDILSGGKQTVLPPSVHPDTKKSYVYLGDSLDFKDLSKDELRSEYSEFSPINVKDIETIFRLIMEKKFPDEMKKIKDGKDYKSPPGGRNDVLKIYVAQLFDKYTPKEAIDKLIKKDKELHGNKALFEDKNEFRGCGDSRVNAAKFYGSMSKTISDKIAEREFEEIQKLDQAENLQESLEKAHQEMMFNCGFYENVETKRGIIEVPKFLELAKHLKKEMNFKCDDSYFVIYENGHYRNVSKTHLSNIINRLTKNQLKPGHIEGFMKMIKAECYLNKGDFRPADGLVNLKNGVLDVKNKKLLPHSPDYNFTYVLNHKFDADAECPLWENFLLEVFNNNIELIDLSQRLFGYLLIGGRPFLHKAFVLLGEGRNGKSTYLDIMRAVIGTESYSTVSMSKLDKEFSVVAIDGKLANIVEEAPNDEINAEAFKNLVGGGEIQASHKGLDEYKFRCNARFVFSCNEMPIFKDKSVGLEDRLVFIPFRRFFRLDERDTLLIDKLLLELPGVLNWAIEGACLIMRDRVIPTYEITKESKELYRQETDALYAWFCEETEFDTNVVGVSVRDAYSQYKRDCEDNGNRPYSKDRFCKRIHQMLRDRCEAAGVKHEKDKRDATGGKRLFGHMRLKSYLSALSVSSENPSDKLYNPYN